MTARNSYDRARSAGRTDKAWEEWRVDLLAQVAAGRVLASVFVRFCEDNGLVDATPWWQLAPSADGAREVLGTWWARDDEGREIRHDITDPSLDTCFLGGLYQDLS